MSQLTLIDGLPPAQSHSETSRAAAESIESHVSEQQARILRALEQSRAVWGDRGLTDEEIQDLTNLPANSERPRRIELLRRGLITQRGEGVTRSGRRAVTWDLAS